MLKESTIKEINKDLNIKKEHLKTLRAYGDKYNYNIEMMPVLVIRDKRGNAGEIFFPSDSTIFMNEGR